MSRPMPAIVAQRFVPSPPNPVVFAHRCGMNAGTVEEEAPEATDGDVVSTEFITSPTIQLHQVTLAGACAEKSQEPLAVVFTITAEFTTPPAGTV